MFEDENSENKNLSGRKDVKIKADPDRKFASEKDMVSVPITGSLADRGDSEQNSLEMSR